MSAQAATTGMYTYWQTNLSLHVGRTKYVKCPKCGKQNWQRKVVTKEDYLDFSIGCAFWEDGKLKSWATDMVNALVSA